MTIEASRTAPLTFTHWQQDLIAGLTVGFVALPVCLAAGTLVSAPLGPHFVAEGAAAGLYGAIVAGALVALVATSSFVITCPRAGAAVVLASLVMALAANPTFAGKPELILAAAALCVLLAGVWQILFGVLRFSSIIKFTPHPVFAGFLNGAALLIIGSQITPFFVDRGVAHLLPEHAAKLIFIIGAALLAVYYLRLVGKLGLPRWMSKLPGTIVTFVLGIAVFYVARQFMPALDFGGTIGQPDIELNSPLVPLLQPENAARIWTVGGHVVIASLVLALVTSLESLMALRFAQNLGDIEIHPARDLAAQGCGNCATALFAAIASSGTTSLLATAYRAGGRTRLTGLVASSVILLIGLVLSRAIAAIPGAIVSGVLLSIGISMFDAGSFRLFREVVRNASPHARHRAIFDLLTIAVVMGVTVMTTVVIGVIIGCLLSVIIFVVNMSRPVVHRSHSGSEIFSKRVRSTEDVALLQASGHSRVVLALQGVLFFGNAEDLAQQVKQLFNHADMIVLDMRAITDIDASGSNILGNLVTRCRARGKQLLFCNVPAAQLLVVRSLFDRPQSADAAIKVDLESALEWMEEQALRHGLEERGRSGSLALDEIELLDGIAPEELAKLRPMLKLREFKAGDAICREGDAGDRMWLLVKGSVSVRLNVSDHRGSRRIASLGRGTVFGEMALIEGGRRSATIVADEDVACYELSSADFDVLLRDSPDTAVRILRNTARELARRLRRTSEDFRHTAS